MAGPHLPALARSGSGRRPAAAAAYPARRVRRVQLGGADPVPDGGCRRRPRPGGAVAGDLRRDQRPSVLGRRTGPAGHRVPHPRGLPARGRARSPSRVRAAVHVGEDAGRRGGRRTDLLLAPAVAGPARCRHPDRGPSRVRPFHPESRWATSSRPGGDCTRTPSVERSTSPTGTRCGRCTRPSWCTSTTSWSTYAASPASARGRRTRCCSRAGCGPCSRSPSTRGAHCRSFDQLVS